MLLATVALLGAIAIGLLVAAAVFMVGMRRKWPWVQGAVVWVSRAVIDPRQMRSAGKPGAYASVICHRGRTSGRTYETPVGAVPTADGFVVALPYGRRVSWLRNVLASGSATIIHEGGVFEVDRPEVVTMASVAGIFSPGDQRSHRLFGVEECLRVRRTAEAVFPREAGLGWRAV